MKKYNPPPRRNFHIGEEGSINFDIGRKFPYGILFTSLSLPRFSYFFSFFTPRFSAPLVFYRACHAHEARTTLQKRFLKQIYCPRARWVRAANTRRTERNQPPSTLSLPPPRTELFCTTASSFPSPGRSLDIYVPLHF